MTDYPSLELCKELFELLGKKVDSFHDYYYGDDGILRRSIEGAIWSGIPAYSLTWLLDKLPRKINGVNSRQREGNFNLYASRGSKTAWVASYADSDCSIVRRKKKDAESNNYRNFWFVQAQGSSPADAACTLLITLVKEKIV